MVFNHDTPSTGRIDSLTERYFTIPRWQRLLMALLGVLLPMLLFAWLSYLPKNLQLRALQSDQKVLSAQLDLLKRKAERADETEQLARRVEAAFNHALQALPSSDEIPSLLASISDAGKAAGLEFLLFEPQPATDFTFYAEIPIKISVTGSFGGVGRFFESVANLPRVVNIDTITMALDPISGWLKVDCRAVTYKFDDTATQKRPEETAS